MPEILGYKTKSKLMKKKPEAMSDLLPGFFLQSGVNKNKKIKSQKCKNA